MKYLMMMTLLLMTNACAAAGSKVFAVGTTALIAGTAGAQINEDFDIAPVQKKGK